ncbi:MAG: glycine--tRNA ligase subunit beta [Rhodospirillaceae bacterium]|nr:glycine--tRNA ligase subunit beta [Rhodospirillaceae bacterium]
MAELLLELLSEEIPARMQARAAADLLRLVGERLRAAGLDFERAESFVTPRRLALVVEGLPLQQPDTVEERRGPRVGAPETAIRGFLKSAGLDDLAQCEQRDTGKGVFWFARVVRRGAATRAAVPPLLREAIAPLPWPKSMRWAGHRMAWVRPLHGLLLLLDGAVVPLALPLGRGERSGMLVAGDTTAGHRFLAPGPLRVGGFADYKARLLAAKVVLDPAERRARILAQARERAAAEGLTLKPDDALLDEVTGLVEWPVVLMGRIDPGFMDLPPEVLSTSMRTHQKYFSLLDASGRLAPRFLLVANTEAADGGRAIIAGNERVLRARLADARFFWDQDRKVRLQDRVPALGSVIFHASLGSMAEKVDRLQALAADLAAYVPSADREHAQRAALLAKADLTSGMVGEFPELQGVMGRYYALHQGEPAAVADAVAEHHAPLGPGDRCPSAPTSVAVALADKIDTLVGFFAIGEKPTGSKDPYALRRAALGVIRLVTENGLRLPLLKAFAAAEFLLVAQRPQLAGRLDRNELLAFFADRLKVALREKGVRHDLIAAVFALGGEDDLVRLLARVHALETLLATEDGIDLLTAYKRASNIVRIEERKDGVRYDGAVDAGLLAQAEEIALHERLGAARGRIDAAVAGEDFAGAMGLLAELRPSIDCFFDKVTVNVPDAALRANRLRLLSQIRDVMGAVADFARVEG